MKQSHYFQVLWAIALEKGKLLAPEWGSFFCLTLLAKPTGRLHKKGPSRLGKTQQGPTEDNNLSGLQKSAHSSVTHRPGILGGHQRTSAQKGNSRGNTWERSPPSFSLRQLKGHLCCSYDRGGGHVSTRGLGSEWKPVWCPKNDYSEEKRPLAHRPWAFLSKLKTFLWSLGSRNHTPWQALPLAG